MSLEERVAELEEGIIDLIGIITGIMSTLTAEQVTAIVKFTDLYRVELEEANR